MYLIMKWMHFFAVLLLPKVLSQRNFYCVIPAYCNDFVDIDIRIQTPNTNTPRPTPPPSTNSCPAGYISCRNIKCGYSLVRADLRNGVATKGAFPWHVFLQNIDTASDPKTRGYIGGGVLITQYWVLTAAHKVLNFNTNTQPTKIRALFGLFNLSEVVNWPKTVVQRIIINANFDNRTLKNDIALLYLQVPVNLDQNVNIACLPQFSANFAGANFNCFVTGFGQTSFTSNDAPYAYLKQAVVPIVSIDYCINVYRAIRIDTDRYIDRNNEICAGGGKDIDACTQDGGSGLSCRDNAGIFTVVGLVIWGKNCGVENRPGVYVNIPSYINYINSVINN